MAGSRFHLDADVLLLYAFLLLILPLPWIIAALSAAAVHELGHAAAVILTGGRIHRVRFGSFGIRMETAPMSSFAEMICAAAGPAASLLLMLFCRAFPRTALCGAVQGICNLIPVYPLDGGRILHGAAHCSGREAQAEKFCDRVEISFLVCLMAAMAAAAVILRSLWLPMMFAMICAGRRIKRKIPCKLAEQRVQ